ncbi:MAG TPA: ABC transporter substrate-binding protein [Chloroflexota bacterium]
MRSDHLRHPRAVDAGPRKSTAPRGQLTRRKFLYAAALSSAALGLLACTPAAPSSPTSPAAQPTQPAKPAAAPTQASVPTAPPQAAPTAAAPTQAAAAASNKPDETPRRGGELIYVVSAEPPSFDGHKETTFAVIHPVSPHYSTLLKFDQENYPNIVGDLAESWSIAPDNLTYTFKLRDGVLFHDGSPMTSRDVKASYDRIIAPPQGIVSARKQSYGAIESVSTPDPLTVVFKLKYVSPAMTLMFASPWNYIYSAARLEQDPVFPEKNIMGTGPFTFVEYVPGSHWVGKRFDGYFDKGKPYLDSFRALFIAETATQEAAIRGERAHVEFRGFTPQARDDIVKALGDKVVVQESPWVADLFATINVTKPPFDDVRVRRALTLAVDRWEGAQALSTISLPKLPGGLVRPGGPFGMPESELVKIAGYGKDGNAAKEQARALLKEAGVPDGFSFTYKNRGIPSPYEPLGVFLIDQWRKVGLNVTQQVLETTAYFNDIRAGNFDVIVDFQADYMDEPDLHLAKFLSVDRNSANYAKFTDRTLDDLYDKQTREIDPEKRKELVWQFERRVLDEQAYIVMTPWWQRIIPHSAKLKGWKILPSHYLNQDLAGVWLTA